MLRLGESKLRPLGVAGERARFLSSGHLALLRAGTLFVVPFDLDRLEVTSEPAPMVRGIRRLSSGHAGHAGQFDVSADGTLVYQLESSTARDLPLVRAAENGGAEVLWQTEDYLLEPDVAPDGRSLLVTRGAGSEWDVWRFDFESGTPTRMTFEPGSEGRTVWAPDSQRFVYTKTTDVGVGVFSLAVDGRGEPEAVLEPGRFWYPVARAWHPDGRRLLFSARGGLHLLDLETGDVEAFFEHRQYSPFEATFSPNGRYVAYVSNEPGYIAIMLRATDGTGRWQITDRLARQPVWSADGTELFFRTDDGLEKVTIDTSSVPRWGRPERLFDLFRGETMLSVDRSQFLDYDVTPDGRFVMNSRANDEPVNHTELHFVSGWSAEVRAAAP